MMLKLSQATSGAAHRYKACSGMLNLLSEAKGSQILNLKARYGADKLDAAEIL